MDEETTSKQTVATLVDAKCAFDTKGYCGTHSGGKSFDMEDPVCTERNRMMNERAKSKVATGDDFMARSIKRRQEAFLAEWWQLRADAAHWNRTHPDEEPIVIEPITAGGNRGVKEWLSRP